MDMTFGVIWSHAEGMRTAINKMKGAIQGLYTQLYNFALELLIERIRSASTFI
jgi:hypothetical protein